MNKTVLNEVKKVVKIHWALNKKYILLSQFIIIAARFVQVLAITSLVKTAFSVIEGRDFRLLSFLTVRSPDTKDILLIIFLVFVLLTLSAILNFLESFVTSSSLLRTEKELTQLALRKIEALNISIRENHSLIEYKTSALRDPRYCSKMANECFRLIIPLTISVLAFSYVLYKDGYSTILLLVAAVPFFITQRFVAREGGAITSKLENASKKFTQQISSKLSSAINTSQSNENLVDTTKEPSYSAYLDVFKQRYLLSQKSFFLSSLVFAVVLPMILAYFLINKGSIELTNITYYLLALQYGLFNLRTAARTFTNVNIFSHYALRFTRNYCSTHPYKKTSTGKTIFFTAPTSNYVSLQLLADSNVFNKVGVTNLPFSKILLLNMANKLLPKDFNKLSKQEKNIALFQIIESQIINGIDFIILDFYRSDFIETDFLDKLNSRTNKEVTFVLSNLKNDLLIGRELLELVKVAKIADKGPDPLGYIDDTDGEDDLL